MNEALKERLAALGYTFVETRPLFVGQSTHISNSGTPKEFEAIAVKESNGRALIAKHIGPNPQAAEHRLVNMVERP